MKIIKLELGDIQTNCYILIDETTKKAAVIDPGDYNSELIDALKNNDIDSVDYILLTHGHYDHIYGVEKLKENYKDAKIAIHELDEVCLRDSERSLKNTTRFASEPDSNIKADIMLHDGDIIKLGNLTLKVIHTPGHTPGGVCFLCDDVMFSGDTLFCKTAGRTDFLGGNMEDILTSIRKLGDLEGDYRVLPGHSIETTLENERHGNRYMRKMIWS